MDTYLGYTLDELKLMFSYDQETGKFVNLKTGNRILDFKVSMRTKEGDCSSLSLNRLAVAIVEDDFPEPDYVVKFKDSNPYNLTYSNLVVVHESENNTRYSQDYKFVETATRGVYHNPVTKMFVVRRGRNQAVYRTYDYKEAVVVRKEWEIDPKTHIWDKTVPYWLKSELSTTNKGKT